MFVFVRYKMAYAMSINGLPSKDEWIRRNMGYIIKPPKSLRPRGRPKVHKIRDKEEAQGGRVSKRIHKCGRCKGWGHHSTTCKEPLGNESGIDHTCEETKRYAFLGILF